MRKKEIWKAIPGWEDLYEISDQGRVKSIPHWRRHVSRKGIESYYLTKENIFDGTYDAKGYMHVRLSRDRQTKIIQSPRPCSEWHF
jgi:hypothetical protein